VRIRAAVIGIGNLLLGDEGAGIHAIRALRERYSFPEGLKLIDGGTMGLDLLPYVEGLDKLLIVDAANLGEPPGTIRLMEGDNVRRFLDTKFSVHQIGLPDMLFAAELQDILPPEVCIVGIQPAVIETGLEMSEALTRSFGALLDAIIKKLGDWGLEIREEKSENLNA
jgi:hydrogenase maturation protease